MQCGVIIDGVPRKSTFCIAPRIYYYGQQTTGAYPARTGHRSCLAPLPALSTRRVRRAANVAATHLSARIGRARHGSGTGQAPRTAKVDRRGAAISIYRRLATMREVRGLDDEVHVLGLLLDEIKSTYAIDANRIYVTGNSMGGYGTWGLAIAYPQRFAAIAPICGGGDPSAVSEIKDVPVWTFHGAKDTVIPVEHSEQMVEHLKACGGNVPFTIYPDVDHDAWTRTYANPQLYTWLLAQTPAQSKEEERQ